MDLTYKFLENKLLIFTLILIMIVLLSGCIGGTENASTLQPPLLPK